MRSRVIAIGTLLMLSAVSMVLGQSANDLFQQALDLEKGAGNCDAAIKIYDRIIRDFARERTLAAKAHIQAGGCYEKLGQDKARGYYMAVINEYKDLPDQVREAQLRLQGPVAQNTEARSQIQTPYTEDPFSFAISPDGRSIVFQATVDGKAQLWLHHLDTGKREPIPGTENARAYSFPFWSPDSLSIGYFAEQKLKRIPVTGGVAKDLSEVVPTIRGGGTWSKAGVILFVKTPGSPLFRVPEGGGEAVAAIAKGTEQFQGYPKFIDDTRFVFYRISGGAAALTIGSLESTTVKNLNQTHAGASLGADHLVYVRAAPSIDDGPLEAQTLDLQRMELTGTPVRLTDRGALDRRYPALAAVSVSNAGRVAYRTEAAVERDFIWRDREGRVTGKLWPADRSSASRFRISPDGRFVAFFRNVGHGTGSMWVIDATGAAPRRFRDMTQELVWSPYGDEVAWSGLQLNTSSAGLFRQPLNRTMGEGDWLIPPTAAAVAPYPQDWSESGFLLYRPTTGSLGDLMAWPLKGGNPIEVARTSADEAQGRFSPNAKWIAYQSDQFGGQYEIFVQPFPGTLSSRKQISMGGGKSPHWGRGGRELYFLAPDFRLMVVELTYSEKGDQIDFTTPRPLFPTALPAGSDFDVAADGERFLINTPLSEAPPIMVLSNWDKGK